MDPMTDAPESLLITLPRTAALKVAPASERIPAPASDAAYPIHCKLVKLHYLAFVALYGPPPAGVSVRFAIIEKPLTPRQPTYLAQHGQLASPQAAEWTMAFEAGLDRWDEAEMADPLTVLLPLEEEGELHIEVATWEAAVVGACRRLKRAGRLTELRNIAAHVGPLLPAQFNPDSPAFSEPA